MGLKELLFGKKIEGKVIEKVHVIWMGSFSYARGDDHVALDILDNSGNTHHLAVMDSVNGLVSKSGSIEEGEYIKAKTPGFFKKLIQEDTSQLIRMN